MNRTQIQKITKQKFVQTDIKKLEKNKSLENEKNKINDQAHLQASKGIWVLFVTILLCYFNTYIGFVAILFAGLQNSKEQIKYSQKYDNFEVVTRNQILAVIIFIVVIIIGVIFVPHHIQQINDIKNWLTKSLYSILPITKSLKFLRYFIMVLFLVGIAEYIFTPIYVLIHTAFNWQLTEKAKENKKK